MQAYDPIEIGKKVASAVVKKQNGEERKYYRFRGGRWYGGIATADCVGCNLRCKFCWSWKIRDNYWKIGNFYTASQVAFTLDNIAVRRGYRLVRISGGEPTLSRNHLLKVIEKIEQSGLYFILETNGILIGLDRTYAKELSEYSNIHVRVSLKGTNPREFSMLTGAKPEYFDYQIKALENLLDYGVSCNPAVMLSFSPSHNIENLIERLGSIDRRLIDEFEPEYVFLYPHVIELLKIHKLKPLKAYHPEEIPRELI